MEELADETDEGFNSGFHKMEELTDETDEGFNSGFHKMEELTDETDEDFNSGFHKMEELTDETDEDFNSGFHEMEELTDETDEDFNGGFHEMEELTDETDEDFNSGFHEMEELTDEELDKEFDEQFNEAEEEYENIGSQSIVLMHENPEIEGENQEELQAESEEYTEEEEEYLENEEEAIEIDPEEYENNQDPIIDTEEIKFVRDMEELGRMLKEYDEKLGYSEEENDNTAFNAEQAYREIKERNSNKEEKEEAQELEEQEKEITEDQKEEHIEEIFSGDAQGEDVNDTSEEAEIEPEEFDYLWEKYEQYEQEGKNSEEISNLMHEAEETYKLLKNVEKLYEQQEKEKLKLIDHEDEEDDDDVREEIDRVDAIEYFLNTEEKLHQQGKPQEEIDEQVEEIAKDFFLSEIEEKQQNEQEKDMTEELRIKQAEIDEINSDLKESEQIKQISVYSNNENRNIYQEVEKKEAEEEINTELNDIEMDDVEPYQERINESIEKKNKLESKEAEEEEYKKLQQLYRQETSKRSIYAGRETKGFSQWLEQQELKTKELEEKEEKEREEEWQRTLKHWIEGSIEEDLSSELKVILKEIIQNFRNYEDLEELYKKYEKGELTKKVRDEFNSIINKLRNIDPIHLHLYLNISGFKAYFQDRHWWNPALVSEIKYKFLRHLSNKYEVLKKKFKSYKELYKSKKFTSELFEEFLQYTHKIELIKDLINEFNKFGCWIKSLRPTKTFINFMKKKRKLLENVSQNNSSNTIKNQVEILSTYITLIMKIRDNDLLTRAIRNLILKNKGKFNAYDIQEWLLISDTSARNQLKRMFPKEKYQKYIRTQKYVTIKTIEEIAEKKGGKCHTKNIKNAKSKIHLECAEGHHFDTTYNSVVYSNTWCPDCHIYVSETICRQFFKRIFKRPFPKSYPPWLVNEKGNQMELDGYNKELGLAFEYQGIQHRKKTFNMTNEDLQNIKNEDALKLKLCWENNVILIQILDDKIVPYDEIQDYIIQEYERKTGKALENIPKYDYKEFTIYENKYAKKFRACVEKKGGTLLTPYFSAKKEVTLMCEKGHQWTTTPDSIYKDNWCSECAGNTKGTTEEFRKIGKKFNCDLLNEYVNAKTPLRYICQKGHKFKRTPYWLKRTYEEITEICPKCQMELFAEKFQQIVSDKGGYLLTPYKGRFKPIKIKCENNHEWNTTPAVVYQGSWCKICADKNHPNRTRQKTAKLEFYEMVKSLKYTLFSDYENNTKKVYMQCQNQHEFTMTPKYFKRLVNQKVEPCSKCRKNK